MIFPLYRFRTGFFTGPVAQNGGYFIPKSKTEPEKYFPKGQNHRDTCNK
jgi:hypothetical protein